MRVARRLRRPVVGLAASLLAASALGVSGCGGDDGSRTGASDAGSAEAPTTKVAGVAETKALFAGIEQNGLALGDPQAPVILTEVVDLQCPFCKAHQLDVQPKIVKDLVRTGRVQLHLVPVSFLGEDSQRMEIVLLRFARSQQAWQFTNLVYWNQGQERSGYATDAWLRQIAAAVPGTKSATVDELASTTPDAGIAKAAQESQAFAQNVIGKAGGGGTPFFAIAAKGQGLDDFTPILSGADPNSYAHILAAVEAVEAGRRPKAYRKASGSQQPSGPPAGGSS
ncbi:MAG: thioredoxin domain-containing protein [Patulibacter minatonensis]